MIEKSVISGVVMNESIDLSLTELCGCCGVSTEFVVELVEEGAVVPEGAQPQQWRFAGVQVKRVQTAAHLAQDLEINLPGIALALDLLDELERLRALEHRRGGF
jgi:chaperone modulatory protein CbpM